MACDVFGEDLQTQSPVLQPEDLVKGRDNWYATLCRQCPTSEGILVRVMEGRAKKVRGNPNYPINWGKQSARCDAGLQALYHPERLAGPMQRVEGVLQPVSWQSALDLLSKELRERDGGLLLITEPLRGHLGMVADRFAKAFGGRHLGFETLDDTTYHAAIKNVFGQDLLPDFDLAHANFLLSFGADFLSTWGSPTRWGAGYGDFRQGEGRSQRGTHVHVDPRFSMTSANADRWLPIRSGMEGYLALSLAYVIIEEDRQAPEVDVGALTGGRGTAALEGFSPEVAGPKMGLPDGMLGGKPAADFIRELAREFADHRPSLAIGGGSAAALGNGLFNLEAIYALNYLVGSVSRPGGLRFNPPSPLPDLPARSRVGSLSDWTKTVADLGSGQPRLVMVHQADPVYGLPESVGFRNALNQSNVFLVSFSSFLDETSAQADLILPDRVYLEDWGSDIPDPGPGYQVIGIQQPVVNPLKELDPRSFPDILLSLAQELERDAELPWNNFQAVLRESSDALYELSRGSVAAASKQEFWTNLLQQGGWWDEEATGPTVRPPEGLFSNIAAKKSALPDLQPNEYYLIPFAHNTLLDGRNNHLPWAQATPDPITTITWQTWVEMNHRRMEQKGLREGDAVRIQTAQGGSIQALAYPNPALPPDVVAVPLGQGRRNGPDYATGRDERESSNVMSILEANQVGGTGALAWASSRVQITPTGEGMRVSKFEGDFAAREIGNQILNNPGEEVIKTVSPGGH